jgi:hypothetical protein
MAFFFVRGMLLSYATFDIPKNQSSFDVLFDHARLRHQNPAATLVVLYFVSFVVDNPSCTLLSTLQAFSVVLIFCRFEDIVHADWSIAVLLISNNTGEVLEAVCCIQTSWHGTGYFSNIISIDYIRLLQR